jgi:hypothetical protein
MIPAVSLRLGAAILAVCAASLLAEPVLAARQPLVLEAMLTERSEDLPAQIRGQTTAATCPVTVATLTDSRRDPLTAGNVNGRAIRSPADVQVFMRSFADALSKRGIAPQFGAQQLGADAQGVSLDLQMVWVSGAASALTANVIVVVATPGPDGQTIRKSYRGRRVNMNWNDGNSEIQKVVNQAFGDALDQIAADLRMRCA